jgi:hypothetical protein
VVWNEPTRRETERILRQIPRLALAHFAPLFREEDQFLGETHPEEFDYVPDPAARTSSTGQGALRRTPVSRIGRWQSAADGKAASADASGAKVA